jgi:hypothetical protein
MNPLDHQNEHIPTLASLVQAIGLEFSVYTRRQAYSIIGIRIFQQTDNICYPDNICDPLDIAEPGLTSEYLKKFKRVVLRFHPDKYNYIHNNKDDLFRLFRHCYAYFKSSVKNRERVTATPISSAYQASEFSGLVDAIIPVNQPFNQQQFNQQYDAKYAKEDADNHGWWRDSSSNNHVLTSDYNVGRYLTPEEVIFQASQNQLVVRKKVGDMEILPANMDDGYFTAASSSKLQYDDIRKVYHDKVWSAVNEHEYGHLITRDVTQEFNLRKKQGFC